MEADLEEETKLLTLAEARARFDQEAVQPQKHTTQVEMQPKGPPAAPVGVKFKPGLEEVAPKPVPEVMPKKVMPPVWKPVPPKPLAKPEKMAPEGVKSPSPRLLMHSYIINC